MPRRWALVAGLRQLGPGLVSGASDNDPTTVGAVSAVGAATGYRLAWLALVVFPALATIELLATGLAMGSGRDLQTAATERFGPRWAALLAASIVPVNVLTIAADLQAGGAALGLLLPWHGRWLVVPLALVPAALLLRRGYGELERVLKFVLLGLFIYVGAALAAHPDWTRVAVDSVVPRLGSDRNAIDAAMALVGTTVTSYVYVWQTVGVSEVPRASGGERVRRRDALVGAAVLTAIVWSILVSAAQLQGRHEAITTASQAAGALSPLVGTAARYVFGAALLASSLLALPILAAATGYVVGAAFDWRRGLGRPVGRARAFYAVMLVAIGLAAVVSFTGVAPITMLVIASTVGGVLAPIGLAFLVRLATDRHATRGQTASKGLAAAGWLLTALAALLAAVFFYRHLA